ncbi:MAG TPA: ABC transporter permease, partial [Beijerinckiaceae bacterium]|nr:ABC transporter permease [Beijerinckiaceae bacterium]
MNALAEISTLIAVVLASALRLSVPLIAACLAGLWCERSGIVDIGL